MFGDSNGQIELRAKQKFQFSICYSRAAAVFWGAASKTASSLFSKFP